MAAFPPTIVSFRVPWPPRPLWLPLVVTLGLAPGCTLHEASSPTVEVPLPARWSSESARAGTIRARWWEDFGQPRLSALIARALEGSHDLRAAAARIEAARAQARVAGADRLPQVQASLSRSREKQNFIGLPIPGAEEGVLSTTFDSASANLEVSWEPDLWGRIRSGELAAAAELRATAADYRGARVSLAAETANAWFAAVEARRQLALARETAESFRETERSVRRRYEAGLRPPLDLRLALSNTAIAEAAVAQRRAQLDAARRQLEVLIGSYPAARLDLAEELPALPPPPPAGLPAQILARRPDLAAAEQRVLAAAARFDEARAGLYPRLSLTGSRGYVSGSLREVLRGNFPVWSVLGSVLQPIWQGGRLRATIDLNDARAREAAADFASRVLQALAEVEVALAAEQFLATREAALDAAVEHAVAAQELAQRRYAAGLVDIITVLETQRRALDARSQRILLRLQRLQNRIDLYLALGGGFEDAGDSKRTENRERTGRS